MPQVIARVHSDHTMTHCTAPGGRRLDGDSLGHTHIKSAKKWQPETLRHPHRLVLLPNPKAGTHFTVPRRVEGRVGPGTACKGVAACARSHRCAPWWVLGPVGFGGREPPDSFVTCTQENEVSANLNEKKPRGERTCLISHSFIAPSGAGFSIFC